MPCWAEFTQNTKYLLSAQYATRETPGQGCGGGTARMFPLWPDNLAGSGFAVYGLKK